MREIVFDTETTGLRAEDGDRVIEIGCVEVINRIRTGKFYHTYLNVDKESSAGALNVHGLTKEFLSDKPKFSEICDDFLNFIADDGLVIHNAQFDLKFINNELSLHNIGNLTNQHVDTLLLARRKFPGSPANLDALCKRYNIDGSKRVKHGALLDAELLADVYLELTGGSQTMMNLNSKKTDITENNIKKTEFKQRKFPASQQEIELHTKMLKNIKNNLW